MGTADIIILCVLMLLVGIFLGICVVMAVVLIASREKKAQLPAQKQKEPEEPCETCLRWDECNGTDERCPYR